MVCVVIVWPRILSSNDIHRWCQFLLRVGRNVIQKTPHHDYSRKYYVLVYTGSPPQANCGDRKKNSPKSARPNGHQFFRIQNRRLFIDQQKEARKWHWIVCGCTPCLASGFVLLCLGTPDTCKLWSFC